MQGTQNRNKERETAVSPKRLEPIHSNRRCQKQNLRRSKILKSQFFSTCFVGMAINTVPEYFSRKSKPPNSDINRFYCNNSEHKCFLSLAKACGCKSICLLKRSLCYCFQLQMYLAFMRVILNFVCLWKSESGAEYSGYAERGGGCCCRHNILL